MKKKYFMLLLILIVIVISGIIMLKTQNTTLGRTEKRTAAKISEETYRNPVYVPDFSSISNIADPTVVKFNGEYYLYGTTGISGFDVLHSRDLIHWEYKGIAYGVPGWDGKGKSPWNKNWFWAPCIVYKNGTFYLYYSAGDQEMGDGSRNIGVATSKSPTGPFLDYSKNPIITDENSIDGYVFSDDDGRMYFYYNQVDANFNGTAVREMQDMFSFKTEETKVVEISEPWEGSINEGPVVLKHGGIYYHMYSGGNYYDSTYAMGYATSKNPMGLDKMKDESWTKFNNNPILKSSNQAIGPGHHDIQKAPNNVTDFIIYHTKQFEEDGGERQIAIDRMFWNHDKIWTCGPTTSPMEVPQKPDFQDWFDGKDGDLPKDSWKELGGTWRINNNELKQKSTNSDESVLLQKTAAINYVYEVNLMLDKDIHAGDYGLYASYKDKDNYLKVVLIPSKKRVEIQTRTDGDETVITSRQLNEDFDYNSFHQLLLYKNTGELKLIIDGIPYLTGKTKLEGGAIGLTTNNVAATFDGIALTSYFEDSFDSEPVSIKEAGYIGSQLSNFEIKGHELIGTAKTEEAGIFKGEELENYEFTTDIRHVGKDLTDQNFGVYGVYKDKKNYARLTFKQDKFPGKYYLEIEIREGNKKTCNTIDLKDLPYGAYAPNDYHTLRVTKKGAKLAIYVDGIKVGESIVNIDFGRIGLTSGKGYTAFDNVAVVKLN